MLKALYKKLFSKKEVIELPKVKTVNISSKYLKNKLPDVQDLNLKIRREKLGLTRREVYGITNIAKTTIHNIENGEFDNQYIKIQKLHNFYLEEESKIK